MKKILLSGFVILAFLIYALHDKFSGIPAGAGTSPLNTQTQSSSQPLTNNSNYKDGTYTGTVADAFYGNLQIQAVIKRGQLVDVIFLQYPNDRRNSIEINTAAMPLLKQETIQAQSSSVDIISGATQTSEAFRLTLQSALDQAKSS